MKLRLEVVPPIRGNEGKFEVRLVGIVLGKKYKVSSGIDPTWIYEKRMERLRLKLVGMVLEVCFSKKNEASFGRASAWIYEER